MLVTYEYVALLVHLSSKPACVRSNLRISSRNGRNDRRRDDEVPISVFVVESRKTRARQREDGTDDVRDERWASGP